MDHIWVIVKWTEIYADKLKSGHSLMTKRDLDILPQEHSEKNHVCWVTDKKTKERGNVCCVCVCTHVGIFVTGIKKQVAFFKH